MTERIYGTIFALSNSAKYRQWLKQTRHNWQPMIPDHDLSTQSTESMPISQAETLSMQIDSPRASLISQDQSIQSEASQRTIPFESPQSRSSLHRHLRNANGARYSTAPASVVNVVDIVNYEINPWGGGHRRRNLQPSSHPEPDEATRPARRRRIHDLSPTLSYIHTHTLTTPIRFYEHTHTHHDTR